MGLKAQIIIEQRFIKSHKIKGAKRKEFWKILKHLKQKYLDKPVSISE